MRNLMPIILILLLISSCKTPQSTQPKANEREESLVENDTVVINSNENTYEIIVIEPGFNGWLASTARPEGYYSQSFMEGRNRIYVNEWNRRVNQPLNFSPSLYDLPIDYNSNEDYGYELNYKLYNYFIYFQLTYKQRLGPFQPRI